MKRGMIDCPECGYPLTVVKDMRRSESLPNAIRRRRECVRCSARFRTVESVWTEPLTPPPLPPEAQPIIDRGAHVTTLVDRLAYLDDEAAEGDRMTRFRLLRRIGIGPVGVRVLMVLHGAKGRTLTLSYLDTAVPSQRDCDTLDRFKVHVKNIHCAVGRKIIKAQWGVGYFLTPEGLKYVDDLLAETVLP